MEILYCATARDYYRSRPRLPCRPYQAPKLEERTHLGARVVARLLRCATHGRRDLGQQTVAVERRPRWRLVHENALHDGCFERLAPEGWEVAFTAVMLIFASNQLLSPSFRGVTRDLSVCKLLGVSAP